LIKDETLKQLKVAWELLATCLSIGDNPEPAAREKDFFDLVEEARREWQTAKDYFNHVVDPGLVDHAIHAMEAAECKYIFLLKKARQAGYRLPVSMDVLREGR